jgi:hypothetical protein
MSTALAVPTKYQGVPAFQRLAERSQTLMRQNRRLREETKGSVGTVEAVGFTQLGAALAGVTQARGWSEGAVGAAGGALAIAGIMLEQPSMVHVANGVLAPLTAMAAAKWYTNSGFAQSRG